MISNLILALNLLLIFISLNEARFSINEELSFDACILLSELTYGSDSTEDPLSLVLEECRVLIEEKKKKEAEEKEQQMRKEKEIAIYRKYLVSRINGSFKNDFHTIRY